MKYLRFALLLFPLMLAFATPAHADRTSANEAIIRADSAMQSAERAGAGENAASYMTMARDALREARVAFDRRRWEEAKRLAARAQADIELAESISRSARSESNAAALSRTVESLRDELGYQEGGR